MSVEYNVAFGKNKARQGDKGSAGYVVDVDRKRHAAEAYIARATVNGSESGWTFIPLGLMRMRLQLDL